MTQAATTTADPAGAPVAGPAPLIQTRFGALELDAARLVTFGAGLLGFPDHRHYLLADIPEREVALKLLQSADEPELSFLVLPLDPVTGPIAKGDLEAACALLGFEWDACIVLAIVTTRAEDGAATVTVNLKAPVLIDTARRVGCQHVLPGAGYKIRTPLPRKDGHAG